MGKKAEKKRNAKRSSKSFLVFDEESRKSEIHKIGIF